MGCTGGREGGAEKNFQKKPSKDYQFQVYAAIMKHDLEELTELLNEKFDINYRMPSFMKRSALHIAAECGDKAIVDYLILNDAEVNAVDITGAPPAFLAFQKGHFDIVNALISAQANIYIVTNHELFFHNFINPTKHKESMSLLKKIKYNNPNPKSR